MPRKLKVSEQERDQAHALHVAIVEHPQAANHVESSDKLIGMTLGELRALAEQIGIDVEQALATRKFFALDELKVFKGKYECDLTVSLAGATATHRARVLYDYTPDWNWFDVKRKIDRLGWGSLATKLQVLVVDDGPKRWETAEFEEVLITDDLFDRLSERIDEQCREVDKQRRAKAAAKMRGSTSA